MTNSKKTRTYKPLKLIGLATFLGVAAGLLGIAFKWFVDLLAIGFNNVGHVLCSGNTNLTFVVMPLLGSVFLSLFYRFIINEELSLGLSTEEVLKELKYLDRLILEPQQVLKKIIGTTITLISGLSVGAQGFMVYLGGVLGANIAYYYHFSQEQIRIIIGCTVAGALASTFNAPLFGVVFVFEVLLKENSIQDSFPIFISAIMATILRRIIYAPEDLWGLDAASFFVGTNPLNTDGYLEIIIFAVFCGLIASLYIKSIHYSISYFSKKTIPYYMAPIFAGIGTAIIGYFFPAIFRLYQGSDMLLMQGKLSEIPTFFHPSSLLGQGLLMLVTVLAIIFLTSLALGSGGMGGAFMPGIFVGISLGAAYALLLNSFGMEANHSVYAFMGMIGVFSGFSWAPLSAAALALGLISDTNWLIPVLMVVAISTAVTRQCVKTNLYTSHKTEN